MAKLALLVAVLALGAAAFAAFRSPPAAGTGSATGSATPAFDAIVGRVRDVARAETGQRLTEVLTTDVDRRIVRLEQLRKELESAIAEAQRLKEESADTVAARVDTVDRDARQASKALQAKIEALEKAFVTLRDHGGGGSPPARPEPKAPDASEEPVGDPPVDPKSLPDPEEPEGPTPPPTPAPAPTPTGPSEAERKEIEKALADLDQSDTNVLFAAIETIRKRKIREAGPRLTKLLTSHKDSFVRMAAAAALGGIVVADGVDALTEALVDDDPSVATQASKALRQITGFDLDISAKAGIRERRKAKTDMKQWWKEHENEVRTRLGQPKAGAPAPGS